MTVISCGAFYPSMHCMPKECNAWPKRAIKYRHDTVELLEATFNIQTSSLQDIVNFSRLYIISESTLTLLFYIFQRPFTNSGVVWHIEKSHSTALRKVTLHSTEKSHIQQVNLSLLLECQHKSVSHQIRLAAVGQPNLSTATFITQPYVIHFCRLVYQTTQIFCRKILTSWRDSSHFHLGHEDHLHNPGLTTAIQQAQLRHR